MSEEIIIVDDFYDIPFQYFKGFEENKCVITEETLGKISQILGKDIEILYATNEEENFDQILCNLKSDWIAVIYLSLPFESFEHFGIKFYSHIKTGLEKYPTKDELNEFNITESNIMEVFDSGKDGWKEYGNIPAKYNRLVLFKSNRWHSYGFGNNIKYQKIIFKEL